MIFRRREILIGFALLTIEAPLLAYGPSGHEMVGAIADKVIANTPAAKKIYALTDGITLERASVMADEIKAWDKKGVDDPSVFPRYADHPEIDKQLRDFWRANPPTPDPASAIPSHHWFHYTDVPILNAHKYSDGKTGRSQWDIVHMIAYCVDVLRGEVSENNPRKITKPVAVILLAHYVGDIHQPLHVGADYFNEAGQAVDPDKNQPGTEDEGGNTILLRLTHGTPDELADEGLKLHGFWDGDAVMANLKKYAEYWADEILPIAREAHQRLRFVYMHSTVDQGRPIMAGDARENPPPDGVPYADWAAKIVREEIHKAGWRLADLLTQAVESTPINSSTKIAPPEPIAAPPGKAEATSQSVSAPLSAATEASQSNTATPAEEANAASRFGPYPANYKEVIVTWLKKYGLDASRVDWQAEPKPAEMPNGNGQRFSGYLVSFNSPDHAGMKTRSVLIRDGVVVVNNGF